MIITEAVLLLGFAYPLWSRRVDGEKPHRAVSSDVADAVMWMLARVVSQGS